jgi:thiamine-phosphate pyrophosphorylase
MSARAAAVRAPRLMLIVEAADVSARHAVVAAALAAGVDAVQLRDRRVAGGTLLAAARDLRALTRARDALLLVNDRVDVALAAGADGVHLPAASFPTAVARALLGPDAWIGRSTHAAHEAERAAAEGADYVVLGPIFATPSKAAYGPALGIDALAAAARGSHPIVAIGGVDATNAADTHAAGAHGVAVIRAILDAADPAAAARAIRAALDR